ncbi:MAG: two-component sensor histidine kinase [Alphaproteobacteria bacterium]|nr:MAG: two-component sensor histidine kinase [Alphaproteobacteria bacterium]
MTQDDRDARNEDRRSGARWTLATCAAVLALFAYLEPDRLWLAVAGFAVVAAVALAAPRHVAGTDTRGAREPRHGAWPDTSTKAMADALGYPVYIFDGKAILRYANASAEAAFGPARAGDPLSYKFRRPEITRLVDAVIATGERAALEYDERVPGQRWYAASVSPIPAPGADRPRFFILSFVDLTEAKRAEQMRSDFVANASHELRTPLASLRGFIETIQGPAAGDPEATRRFLAVMLQQAERMSRLIDDLLSLSRIEMKRHVRPQEAIDLAGVLRHVVNTLAPMAEDLNVAIALNVPERALTVRGERDELIQVAENLIENACKYGQSGGRVEVTAEVVEPAGQSGAPAVVEVTVRDFGPGIAAEHLPRLTERFYRVDIASSREKQGTGLGLAIVKHILNRHGSKLAVSSTPGEGAAFGFRLPLIDDSASRQL